MTRGLWVAGAVLMAGGLLWLVAIWPVPNTPAAQPASSPAPSQPAAGTASAPHVAVPPPPAAEPEAEAAEAPARPKEPSEAPQDKAEPAHTETATPMPELFGEAQGPLEEYRQRFESEPRDSAAHDAEQSVRSAFEPEQANYALLRSVLCRQSICRVELRWTPEVLGNYIAAMGRMTTDFDASFAATAQGAPAGDHSRPVELFLKRKQ